MKKFFNAEITMTYWQYVIAIFLVLIIYDLIKLVMK